MDEPLCLGMDGTDKARMAVAQVINCKAAEKVQISFSFVVPSTATLSPYKNEWKTGISCEVKFIAFSNQALFLTCHYLAPMRAEQGLLARVLFSSGKSLSRFPPV